MEYAKPHLHHLAVIELALMMQQKHLQLMLNVVVILRAVFPKELDVLAQEPLVRITLGLLMNVVNLLVPLVIALLVQQVKQLEQLAKLKHVVMLHQH